MKSKLNRMVSVVNRLPGALRPRGLSLLIGRVVPFVGTAGLCIEEMTEERVVVRMPNRRRAQNHIGGLHAAATALALETASGFVVGMNLPEDKLPLMKSMKVEYRKRARGGLRATATLTEEQLARMAAEPKGEVSVLVEANDEGGESPVRCEMVWAWVPKKG